MYKRLVKTILLMLLLYGSEGLADGWIAQQIRIPEAYGRGWGIYKGAQFQGCNDGKMAFFAKISAPAWFQRDFNNNRGLTFVPISTSTIQWDMSEGGRKCMPAAYGGGFVPHFPYNANGWCEAGVSCDSDTCCCRHC